MEQIKGNNSKYWNYFPGVDVLKIQFRIFYLILGDLNLKNQLASNSFIQ